MTRRKTVVIGLVGPTLDAGNGPRRWERWRPTVAMCQQENLVVDRLELLYQRPFVSLARMVEADVTRVSPETTVVLREIEIANAWDLGEVYAALLDFARAYPFKPGTEDYLVHITTGTHIAQICLFLLTESRYLPARLLQLSPPGRGRPKSEPGSFAVIDLDLSTYDRVAARFRQEHREGLLFLKSGIETRSRAFNAMIERIEQVAIGSRDPLLLTGPTGAGKSHLARRIYDLKRARRQVEGELVAVNCATLRGDAAMSALFGHVRGAFTGAAAERPGLLRKADGGVLFLDEIGELGLDEQAMLLHAIEEKSFYPVGADKPVTSRFQLVAGTNRDLRAAVTKGTFREDLLARIDLWSFRLPSLRERPEDLPANLEYELEGCSHDLGRRITFSKEARAAFLDFATSPAALWSGNFRDFNGAVRRMATLAPGGRITHAVVVEEIERLRARWATPSESARATSMIDAVLGDRAQALDLFDRVQLEEVLRVCSRSRTLSEAGRELFSVSRTRKSSSNDADRLRKYLARFELDWESLPAGIRQTRKALQG